MRFVITARCERNHTQSVTVDQFNEHDAFQYAKIMDGTSDMYLASPRDDPSSMIGHCGICGGLFTCTVKAA